MKRLFTITSIVALILIENAIALFMFDNVQQYKNYQEKLRSNQGLTKTCQSLTVSDDMFHALHTMSSYNAWVYIEPDTIEINYGDEWAFNAGTGLSFGKDYTLVHKSCNVQ